MGEPRVSNRAVWTTVAVAVAFFGGVPALGLFLASRTDTPSPPPVVRATPPTLEQVTVRGSMVALNMTADDVFDIITPDDLVEQTVAPDPQLPGSQVVTKRVQVPDLPENLQLEFRRKGTDTPYFLTRISHVQP